MAARGVGLGDRVFLLIGNSNAFAIAFWAVQIAGAVAVPLPADTAQDRLTWMIDDAEPALILTEREPKAATGVPVLILDPANPMTGIEAGCATATWADPQPDDLALIIYTSGSTGTPKGVMLSQRNVVTAACSVATYLKYNADERIFCAIPFTFDYGLHQLTMAALTGAQVIVERDFSRPFFSLRRLADTRATALPLVPTMGALLQKVGRRFDLSSVRILTNTAAALSEALIDDLRAMMPGARLYSMYGLTECHRCAYLEPDQLDLRKLSVGKAIPFTRMWVVDAQGDRRRHAAVGELVIAGETVMQGYWRNHEATAKRLRRDPQTGKNNFHTGDICRLDEEGYCYFVGRADDMLKVRGQKVAPVEVEQRLMAHPKVGQAAVLGQDDPMLGALVVACIEPLSADPPSEREILDYAAQHLPVHACPARVQIEAALPCNANGKINKRAIVLKEPV